MMNYCKKNGYAKMEKAKYNQICNLEYEWHSPQMTGTGQYIKF